tara:strand:- start:1294 stop:1458 length:165 start_codon:yes stop_codon:yes gene_type:complete
LNLLEKLSELENKLPINATSGEKDAYLKGLWHYADRWRLLKEWAQKQEMNDDTT